MHDSDNCTAWHEVHEFRVGQRVRVVEDCRAWGYGLRAGVVVGDYSAAEHVRRMNALLGLELEELLPTGLTMAEAESCYWPVVVFDEAEGEAAHQLPHAILPLYLVHA